MAPGTAAARSAVLGGLSALQAQSLIDFVALRLAPALVAGLITIQHLDGVGPGAVVFACVLLTGAMIERPRLPLHLVPGARIVVGLLAPLLGVALGWGVFAAAGAPAAIGAASPVIFGTWLVLALGGWIKVRLEEGLRARVAVVGPAEFAADLVAEFEAAGIGTYDVVGWIGPESANALASSFVHLGTLDDARKAVFSKKLDLLVVAPVHQPRAFGVEAPGDPAAEIALSCVDLPVRMISANQLYEEVLGHVPLGTIDAAWFRYIMHPRFEARPGPWQRVFDLAFTIPIGLIAFPLIAAAALAIKLDDGGPVFYRQRRVGDRGRVFDILKLRTMRIDSELDGAQWAVSDDERVTWVGRRLRRSHIDELPQLWNVLRGEMTLVGPRPERPEIIVELERGFAHYSRRHLVKPGLTGWAQVRCGYAGSESGTAWKLCHDLYYLKHRSLMGDALILTQTAFEAGRDAHRALRAPRERFILGDLHAS
jgi:exopolysaccharide biosynthesis polyprenyl glycosylphosphotransferase